ncbi:site-specific integrase [Chelativorans sp. SCAU2101]|uniref:Site-specific integrase n=1 Tax=Chelativorans petroleitrophicus TaxID=2975484 RepID=A0A9X2XCK4_9HYPH|nr:site-specific integrase [Chelativorans petroleitrophicus]MCT8992040.1 site-specific integrase [Chelativorans petroleitrophicus]
MKRRRRAAVSLPKGVHRVVSRGREYFYYQAGRGTDHQGERIKLPNDPHSPEFWQAVRQAQGIVGPVPTGTIGALIDAYETAWPSLPRKLSESTQEKYRQSLRVVRDAWGNLPADSLRPSHVQALIEKIGAKKPGTANNVLDALRAMCRWACGPRELLSRDPTHGVAHFDRGEGHKPWTPEQLDFADKHFTGMLRRAYVLGRYTGQRISDLVRLGWTDIDDGGFRLRQKKTGVEPWCPIFPELEAEMATWEKRPGPFLLQDSGRPFTTNLLWKMLDKEREKHPELQGVVWHGLRANAVIRLRQEGYTALQISDAVGMSVPMVERYSRYADRKKGGQAILLSLKERKQDKAVKR